MQGMVQLSQVTAIHTLPPGVRIPGVMFGVPFDVIKSFTGERSGQLYVTLHFKHPEAWKSLMPKLNNEVVRCIMGPWDGKHLSIARRAVVYAAHKQKSAPEVVADIQRLLQAATFDPRQVDCISISVTDTRLAHHALYWADANLSAAERERGFRQAVQEDIGKWGKEKINVQRHEWEQAWAGNYMYDHDYYMVLRVLHDLLGEAVF